MAGDAHELYGLLGGRFEQLVRREVRAPAPLTDNACRSAVGRLVYHAQRVEQHPAVVADEVSGPRGSSRSGRERHELSLEAQFEETAR